MKVKIENGQIAQFPYSVGQLRADNPQVSFPKVISESTLNDYGVYTVELAPVPEYDASTHRVVVDSEPSLVDGVWTLSYTTRLATQEELDAASSGEAQGIRDKRDELLQRTDWMALSDVTISDEWAAYRQALRDVPAQEGFPSNVIWPTKPE